MGFQLIVEWLFIRQQNTVYNHGQFYAGVAIRIKCPNCGNKVTLSSRENQSTHVADLYISCTDVKNCEATFVSTSTFKHYLNPPIKQFNNWLNS
nr:ogr/Delta-like zinc finger family protein [Pseudoalteromonas sp. L21]